jgi:hypothetical protein
MALAFMFDLGGEPSPEFLQMQLNLLLIGLAVVPVCYLLLCIVMKCASVPQPPYACFFCIFGTVGSYCVITGLSPSPFTFLVFPWAVGAPPALLFTGIDVARRPRLTRYHYAALICAGLLLLPFLLFAAALLFTFLFR